MMKYIFILFLGMVGGATCAFAQDAPNDAAVVTTTGLEADATVPEAPKSGAKEEVTGPGKVLEMQISYAKPEINVDQIPSLFFSIWEHDLVSDARRGLNTRPPGSEEGAEGVAPDGVREISLGGIVYTGVKDWTIWLNNKRISPGRIPNEIMDIKVYKDHIDIEWFDEATNQIFPIRLRAHQRFNLDSRIFLPGA